MSKTESVTAQMAELLDGYVAGANEVVEKAAKETAKDCATELQNTSAKGPKGYARSWTAKKHDGGWVTYNKQYWLTHLLENGHAIANQYGEYSGRVPGDKHIADAEKNGIEQFQNKIARGL